MQRDEERALDLRTDVSEGDRAALRAQQLRMQQNEAVRPCAHLSDALFI